MKRSLILLTSAALLSLSTFFTAPALADEPAAAPSAAQVAQSPAPQGVKSEGKVDLDALAEAGITPELAQRLTSEQIFRLLEQRAKNENHHGEEGIVIPIALFLFLFLGVTAGLYIAFRKDRERQETLRAVIQRGGAIPPALLVPPVKKFSDLRRGIILIAGGLGLSIFVGVMPTERGLWTMGLIPALVGAGYLLAWKLTRSDPAATKDEAQIAAEREVNSL